MNRSADIEETAPATGLAATPGDYRFPPGMVAGRYVLGERLGAGGMGIVYAAHDARLDRRVALKLLRPDASGWVEAHQRIVREARTLARLAHPNVVTVHDVGDFEGRFYVEMELVQGSTLAQWLRAEDRTWQEVLAVFLQAGRGLAAVHAVGIVHRDFKPDNVLVGDDGRVRVADFGIALFGRERRAGSEPSTGSAGREEPDGPDSVAEGGTPGYMSPEQKSGARADARSDQYSFCVVLSEALHGERDLDPPAWLDQAIERGLAASPAERYAAMEELLDVLVAEPRRRRGRRRTAVGIAASALMLVVGVAGGSAVHATGLVRGLEARANGPRRVARSEIGPAPGGEGTHAGTSERAHVIGLRPSP